MGICIGLALILAVAGTNVITWAVAARVRLRREAQTPYRGGKLGTGEWKESCGEALAATPIAFWFYSAGVLVIMTAIFGLGLVTSDLQDLFAEAASAEETAADATESPESARLTEMLERADRCAAARADLLDPRENLGDYWRQIDSDSWDGSDCGTDTEAPLLQLLPEDLVRGLDTISVVDDDEHFSGGWYRRQEEAFLRLVKTRNRADDRSLLMRRLYGEPSTFQGAITEARRRYLILMALNEAGAGGPELIAALEYTVKYRIGDDSGFAVTLREMAREMLVNLRAREVASDVSGAANR